jgi:hypothetical protein
VEYWAGTDLSIMADDNKAMCRNMTIFFWEPFIYPNKEITEIATEK